MKSKELEQKKKKYSGQAAIFFYNCYLHFFTSVWPGYEANS